jgi:hypothetical protein
MTLTHHQMCEKRVNTLLMKPSILFIFKLNYLSLTSLDKIKCEILSTEIICTMYFETLQYMLDVMKQFFKLFSDITLNRAAI